MTNPKPTPKLSKTDWIDLALAAELTPDGRLSSSACAAWSVVRAAACQYRLRAQLVLIGPTAPESAAKLTRLGADRLFIYEPKETFSAADALRAFCEDYKPALLAFPNELRTEAETAAAMMEIELVSEWEGGIELDRAKDLRRDAEKLECVAAFRPQLVVFAAGQQTIPLPAEEKAIQEIFFCFP